MSNFRIEETRRIYGAKIKVVGVGGGGGNMINHMASEGISGVDLIAVNTDAQALEKIKADYKVQIGEKTTGGMGSGMRPEVGKASADENYEELKAALDHSDIVFIAAGLGGGTGTGAAPIVAQAAKEVGALTVSVVTKPFAFEGKKRAEYAEAGLQELKKESDSIVVIPNDKLLAIIDKNLGIKDSFKLVDSVLARAVKGMSGVILSSGVINVDFADVKTVMSHRGMALLGVGEASGDDAACDAVRNAIQSPLLDDMNFNGALGVLVHFYVHPDCPFTKIGEAMDIVRDASDVQAHVIFGVTEDESVTDNLARVTIIATGFDGRIEDIGTIAGGVNKPIEKIYDAEDLRMKLKVVGGDDGTDYLEIPTWMRNKMD
jgi:cell division protein FtsZ